MTGAQLNDGSGTTIAPNTDQPLQIGECASAGGGGGFQGTIDDVAVISGAMGGNAIASNGSGGIPEPEGGWPGQHGGTCTGIRCPQSVEAKNPLVFVPGILGSAISDKCGSPDKDPWPGALFDSSRLDHIAINPDGSDKSGHCPQPDGVLLDVLGQDVYGTAWNRLKDAGYVEDKTLFAFPYDWRRSAIYNARKLVDYVGRIYLETGKKVDILAHSQGGLVTMAALRMHDSLGIVRRVVTMGTPAEGAAKAFSVLEYKSPCVVSELDLKLFKICPLNMGIVQKDIENMPGFYELLPAPYYGPAVGTSPLIQTNGFGLIYPDWLDFVAKDHSRSLLEATGNFHYNTIDVFRPLDPSVEMRRYVGNRHSTIVAIRLERTCFWTRFGKVCSTRHRAITSTLGDGTVPLNSADMQNTNNAFDERNGIPNSYFPFSHLGLTQQARSMNAAINFFAEQHVLFRAKRNADVPADEGDLVPGTPSTAIHVEVSGDATAWVGDMGGGTIGESAPDGPAIDGASDQSLDGTAAFSLDAAGTYALHVTSTGDQPLRVVIDRRSDTVQQQSTFYLTQSQQGELLTLEFGSEQDLAQLRLGVDVNGDGTVDQQLAPTATVSGDVPTDVTPPTTLAGATITSLLRSTVTLKATDDAGGSGVAATYYVLDGADQPMLYTGPFTAPLFSKVQYWSVDRLGNLEDVQTVVVDDAPNVRELAAPLAAGRTVLRTIWPVGDEDWYTFTADGVSAYRARLIGFPSDLDLELYDAAGNLVQAPHLRSAADEEVGSVLPAGTYYLRVLGHGGTADRGHVYALKLQRVSR